MHKDMVYVRVYMPTCVHVCARVVQVLTTNAQTSIQKLVRNHSLTFMLLQNEINCEQTLKKNTTNDPTHTPPPHRAHTHTPHTHTFGSEVTNQILVWSLLKKINLPLCSNAIIQCYVGIPRVLIDEKRIKYVEIWVQLNTSFGYLRNNSCNRFSLRIDGWF